jgi:hypothetical protein
LNTKSGCVILRTLSEVAHQLEEVFKYHIERGKKDGLNIYQYTGTW